MLILDKVNLTFGQGTPLERPLFTDLSFMMTNDDFVVLVGDNGSGKSSLLNLISGMMAPQSGRVMVNGQDLENLSVRKRASLIAHVVQDPRHGTLENLTIEENMSFAYQRGQPRRLWPSRTRAQRDLFRHRLRALDMNLENRLKDPVATLSGGQRQALSLIMATLRPARILLLDEMTAALDRKTAMILLALTQRLVEEENITTLMITHNPQEIDFLGRRTVRLIEGRLQDVSV